MRFQRSNTEKEVADYPDWVNGLGPLLAHILHPSRGYHTSAVKFIILISTHTSMCTITQTPIGFPGSLQSRDMQDPHAVFTRVRHRKYEKGLTWLSLG